MGGKFLDWKQNRNNRIKNRLPVAARKKLQKLIPLTALSVALLVSTLTTSFAKPVFAADSTILYDGKKQEVAFEHISGTDLFQGFKNLMPGDTREQLIKLNVKRIGRETSFYLTADCDERTKELLHDVTLSLYHGETLLLENAKMSESLKLATLGEGQEVRLRAVLKVPVTLGNEIAGEKLPIKWHFIVQQDGKEIVNETVPDQFETQHNSVTTGDTTVLIPTLGMLIISAIVVLSGLNKCMKKLKKK